MCFTRRTDTCCKGDAVDGMFSNNIHPHMECGTAKTLMELFLYRIHHHRSAVRRVGGSVLCGRGRRITENIRVEVDGALARGTDAAVVFKWSLEHGNSIIHGLETSSIHLYPSLPLSLQAPAPIVCLNGLLPPHLSPLLRLIVIPSAILSPHFSYLWTVHC